MLRYALRAILTFSFFLFPFSQASQAHPIARRTYDRTIAVRLTAEGVVVHYRLEVDAFTVVYDALPAVSDKVDLAKLSKPEEFYEAFTRSYAPIFADNLVATLDRKPLAFQCTREGHSLRDEEGRPLDHLRCDFIFQAPWRLGPGERHEFTFREGNYELEAGQVRLSLTSTAPVEFLQKTEPDKALQALPATDLKPGDEARLRQAAATFVLQPEAKAESAAAKPDPGEAPPAGPAGAHGDQGLLALLLDSRRGLWVLLALAAAFGAAHALTPGHGKTLVAAYLVGEQGTVWHAFLLGLITTLTHTGAVLILAAVLYWLFPRGIQSEATQQNLLFGLRLGGGLLIAGLGYWMLRRRLAGRADHFHLGGHGHHHHGHSHDHGHADHFHDEHGHAHPLPPSLGWGGLVLLGVGGGIVPCMDAIIMLLLAVAMNLIWLALPLLVAFSAGLASVLVLLGIAVVRAKGLVASRWGTTPLFRALPLLSAVVVTGLGLWLCLAAGLDWLLAPSGRPG
jgi:ABC-type nickel/cobalt efflux system permease component RcnA